MNDTERIECECFIPEWAVCALEYGDTEGLEDEDVEVINDWVKSFADEGYEFDVIFDSCESFFCAFPEFGLACDCVTAKLVLREVNQKA